MRMQSGRVTQRCHNSPRCEMEASEFECRHSPEARGGFWQILKKSVTWGEDGWFSLARGDLCGGCHTWWSGGRWKSQNRKIVPLSPYVEKPLNSKIIKSFVPEQRSQVFFRISWFLYSIFMDIRCTFHTKPYHCYGIVLCSLVHFHP